jgi:hypothetical protein
MTTYAPEITADKLRALSTEAAKSAEACSRRGDRDGTLYCQGMRDAYATAASFADDQWTDR